VCRHPLDHKRRARLGQGMFWTLFRIASANSARSRTAPGDCVSGPGLSDGSILREMFINKCFGLHPKCARGCAPATTGGSCHCHYDKQLKSE
jgi:hypothetical protein